MRAKLSTTFQSLQVRNYRLFAIGQLIKLIGVWMMFIAQDWLVLELTDNSATALGVVTAFQFTPVLLLTLLSGRLADRYDKRLLLFVANASWSVLALCMSLLVLTDLVQLWHVFVFAALLGMANAVETPVRQSFVSELVGTPLLPNALSLSRGDLQLRPHRRPGRGRPGHRRLRRRPGLPVHRRQLARAAGQPGPDARRPTCTARRCCRCDERDSARVIDGLRYVWRRPDLLLPMALMSVIGMSLFNFQLTLAALAKTVFHTGAASFGLFTTALAVGALGRRAGRHRPAQPPLGLGGARRGGRLRQLRHPGRPRPGVLAGGGAAGAHRLLHGLLRAGRPTSGSRSASTPPSGAG